MIGANDVTNPAARSDTSSPIYGMPILDVDKARTVMVIKRSMNPGFAGIDNPLYYLDNTLMLFGDAKAFVGSIVRELTRRCLRMANGTVRHRCLVSLIRRSYAYLSPVVHCSVFCWPLALLVLVLYPFVWLVLLPFRIMGIAVEGVLELLKAIILLPARLLRGPRRAW